MTNIAESFVFSDRISLLLESPLVDFLGSLQLAAAIIDNDLNLHFYNDRFAMKVLINRRNIPPFLVKIIREFTSISGKDDRYTSLSAFGIDGLSCFEYNKLAKAKSLSCKRDNKMGFNIIKIIEKLGEDEGAKELLLLLEKDFKSSEGGTSSWDVIEKLIVSEKVEAIARLSAGSAHQINNPLTYVISNFDVLQKRIDEMAKLLSRLIEYGKNNKSSTLQELLSDIDSAFQIEDSTELLVETQDGLERIANIVKTLGLLGDCTFQEKSLIDINNLLQQLLLLIEPLHKSNVTLILKLSETLSSIPGNRNRLTVAFLNLLGNAAESIIEGSEERNSISVCTTEMAGKVLIEIEDTGAGISIEDRNKIFAPFFSTKIGKTGLGLTVALFIIEQHGGSLDIDSEVGRGTRVSVLLPAKQLEAGKSRQNDSPVAVNQSLRKKVLIVDDEKLILKSFERLFSREYQIVTANSADSALDILAREPDFDSILLDLVMPVKSGIRLSKEIKEKYPELHRKIIFITGGTFTEESRIFCEETDRPCIFKPFNKEEIVEVINHTTSNKGRWEKGK
jgi:signal transduction histidine kinase/ActR/RegA family two-component response regulator